MAGAEDVAAYVLDRLGTAVAASKLQKLLYYCQGWHLAWDAEKLFDAEIQAWPDGPIVSDVHGLRRGCRLVEPPWPAGADPSALTDAEAATVDAVLVTYGAWSADQLTQTTLSERPWCEAREGLPANARCDATGDTDVMQDFFIGLWEAHFLLDHDG